MNRQQVKKAAETLLAAWQSGGTIAGFPADATPVTLDDAYDVQDALAAALGRKVAGWKLAHSSAAALQKLNLTAPPFGRVFEGTLVESGASIPRKSIHKPKLEAEIAVKLGRDLPKRDQAHTKDEIAAAVASVHLAIEVADSRYADPSKIDLAAFVADNAQSGFLVIGRAVTDWRARDFQSGPATLSLDGRVLAEAAARESRCDPLLAVAQVAGAMSRRGIALKAGEIITTGSHVPPQACASGGRIEADFGPLGKVAVTLAG
jgi:2-keto-4-pentenoate hydratase